MDAKALKHNYQDYYVPSLVMVLITAAVFAGFYFVKSLNGSLICRIAEVAGEETEPTAGRLICCLLFLALSVSLIVLANIRWRKDDSKVLSNWALSALGGTLLWTSIGECSWHFGMRVVTDEGGELFTNFPRIESVQGLPFFFLAALLLVAGFKKLSFPVVTYVLTFLGNWYGHLCMIAAYPIAKLLGCTMDLAQFYKVSALVNAVLIAVAGGFIIFSKTARTTKHLAAIGIYVALGNVLFGIIMGET